MIPFSYIYLHVCLSNCTIKYQNRHRWKELKNTLHNRFVVFSQTETLEKCKYDQSNKFLRLVNYCYVYSTCFIEIILFWTGNLINAYINTRFLNHSAAKNPRMTNMFPCKNSQPNDQLLEALRNRPNITGQWEKSSREGRWRILTRCHHSEQKSKDQSIQTNC